MSLFLHSTVCLPLIQPVNISFVPAGSTNNIECVFYGGQYCWMCVGLSGSEFDSAGAGALRESG